MNMLRSEKSPARVALFVTIFFASSLLLAIVGLGGSSSAQVDPYASGSPTVLPTRIVITPSTTTHTASPGDSPSVLPTRHERDNDNDEDDVAAVLPTRVGGGTLPFTGGDLVLFVATGASIIGTGTLLVRRSRGR